MVNKTPVPLLVSSVTTGGERRRYGIVSVVRIEGMTIICRQLAAMLTTMNILPETDSNTKYKI